MVNTRGRWFRNARTFALIAMSAVTVSCKDSTGPAGVTGTWTLQSIDGSPLPVVVFQDASGTERITASTLVLNANGTFTVNITFTSTPTGGSATTFNASESGTYVVNGSTVTFTFTDDEGTSTDTGTISGNTLTVVADGEAWVFTR